MLKPVSPTPHEDVSDLTVHQVPSTIGVAVSASFQLLLLACLLSFFLGDLQRCCTSKRRTTTALLAGALAVMLLRLVVLLVTDDGTYGPICRRHYSSDLPDSFWIVADFIEHGLLGFGGLGLVATWLAIRYWAGGIRPDKTTATIIGVLTGLAIGAAVEYSQVLSGSAGAMNPPRLVFFSLLGGFLALVSRLFLVRKGRFQFSLRSLLALTAVWALIFGLLSPQWSRYQSETEAMSSLATLLGGPVRCARTEGLVGLAHVDFIDLPAGKIDDAKLDAVITQLKRLPHLISVNVKMAALSQQGFERLENALPGVSLGEISSSENRDEEFLPDKQPQRKSKSAGG